MPSEIEHTGKNESEMLFEEHLRSYDYAHPDFEPTIEGTPRRPDYRLVWNGHELLFEVKEFRGTAKAFASKGGSFGSFDPYSPVRKKIDAARKKFRDLGSHCCCLVLYNRDKPLVLLDWQYMYGAMLGNVGFSVPIHVPGLSVPEGDEITSIFMSDGKMHEKRQGVAVAPQNQTISAILVLNRVPVGKKLFLVSLQKKEARRGRKLDPEELITELDAAQWTPLDTRRRPLRVVVYENPYARIPLPAQLFRGPYDERYGELDGRVRRLFVGSELAKLPSGIGEERREAESQSG